MEMLLTCKEIASRYKVSEDTVWRWIRTKKLAAVKKSKLKKMSDFG